MTPFFYLVENYYGETCEPSNYYYFSFLPIITELLRLYNL